MALTPDNIAKINEFIADHETMDHQALARKYFPGRTLNTNAARSAVSQFVASLRSLDVFLRRGKNKANIESAELAEFRAWKARQNQD